MGSENCFEKFSHVCYARNLPDTLDDIIFNLG